MAEQRKWTSRCLDLVLVRAALGVAPDGDIDSCDIDGRDIDACDIDEEGYLRGVARDPLLREAIAVSSPSLDGVLDRIARGEPLPRKKMRRAAHSISRYVLRMATRATPFGLLAGVGLASFGADPGVTWGTGHAKHVRADLAWLSAVVTELERRPEVVACLRVTANDLCHRRGDRVLVPRLRAVDELTTEAKSIRYTAAVRQALADAARPVPFADLVASLRTTFPAVAEATVTGMLTGLVATSALITELRPPLDGRDQLDHVVTTLATHADRLPADVGDTLAELTAIRAAIAEYATTPVGGSRDRVAALTGRMCRLHAADTPTIQVDTTVDLAVTLPEIVRTELCHGIDALKAISSVHHGRTRADDFHERFLERYGTDRAVPLTDLLESPTWTGATETGGQPPDDRERLLFAIAQQAAMNGDTEVVLDDDHVARLSGDRPGPASLDVLAQLVADSVLDVRAGDFRLVVLMTYLTAGSYAGRFAPHLGAGAARVGDAVRGGPSTVQVVYPPRAGRAANLAQVPIWTDRSVPLGAFADRGAPDVLGLADLAVAADPDRLRVVDARTGEEIVPSMPNMLISDTQAPDAVRLLTAVVRDSRVRPRWRWRGAASLPFLPRVRFGRTIFSPARWLPEPALLVPGNDDWARDFAAWRARWRVPDVVQSVRGDHRITLDLDDERHRALLREEWGREPSAYLAEPPAGTRTGHGWLAGHANEIVFSLADATPDRTTSRQAITVVRDRPVHRPGSDWCYAKWYGPSSTQDEVIAGHLPVLRESLGALVDRWFYVRYTDADGAHLRLRWHVAPDRSPGEPLVVLDEWAGRMASLRLGDRLVLDTYDPEFERYGGVDLAETAELAFEADSESCAAQLAQRRAWSQTFDITVLAAANVADIACRFLGVAEGVAWLADVERTAGQRHDPVARRVIDPAAGWPHLPDLLEGWTRRGAALAKYADRLRATDVDIHRVLRALLHMHHNRLVGIDPGHERRALNLARWAVRRPAGPR